MRNIPVGKPFAARHSALEASRHKASRSVERTATTGRVASAARSLFFGRTPTPPPTARPAFASRVACGAALRGGPAALPPHVPAHLPLHQHQRERIPRLATLDDNVPRAPLTLPIPLAIMVTLPIAVTPMQTTMQTVMLMAVPMMDTESGIHTMRLGASLRDRATLPSPLRGLGPSGGYPSRLRSLRSLRAPLAWRLANAHRHVPVRRLGALDGRLGCATATSSSRRRFAQHSSQCRLRHAPGGARPAAVLVHSCGRSCGARLHFASHRAVHR